ncbi:uncharacterized protein LOC133015541 [Limanda limanda]|uniref:uncharacterized protein LOC133015541 n=1 Tax=Limanda limanda TaxID=27771 RepID=UPI0029C98D51|nr:uncharacterized protein LOC133015541 [Limanda limanda]
MLSTGAECVFMGLFLYISDLQVKVFPATGEKTVSLMCSSSCPLTERPVVYIWYKNTEFLYQDSSPWYQELISSEESVTYSCAVKGYKHLRAPEVSVASLTSACFTVTYAKGRMCSNQQRPEDEPCSITYPRGVQDQNCFTVNYVNRRICALQGSSVNISSEYSHPSYQQLKSRLWYKYRRSDMVPDLTVKFSPSEEEVTEGQRVTLTCRTSCPLTDNMNYIW